MYEYLEGILTLKNLTYVVIDINGIGFKVNVSLKTYESLSLVGEKEKLYIYNKVSEDDISFFGFKSELEREIFKECLSISGIGAKKALAILSTFNHDELASIITAKDAKELSKVPGIGIKKAEKLIIDLTDKINNLNISSINSTDLLELINKKENLRQALEALGYEKINVSTFISDDEIKSLEMQDLIKIALLNINKKKK